MFDSEYMYEEEDNRYSKWMFCVHNRCDHEGNTLMLKDNTVIKLLVITCTYDTFDICKIHHIQIP